MTRILTALFLLPLIAGSAAAHDTWVETNTHIVRTGDAIYVDLKLGNHGNEHRDFKMASKANPADGTWEVISPAGDKFDLKSVAVDLGYAPKEGFWNAKYVADEAGLYTVSHTRDKIVNHGHAVRSIKSGKTFFIASESLDQVASDLTGFDQPLGHALELVPTENPVAPLGPGKPIAVKLLFQGKPLADTVVSFIPRRETLKEGFDETYERKTDQHGEASFTPKSGDQYLVVAHLKQPEAKGEGYDETAYSATLLVIVPERCPCCGE
ncbi:DUF4198 domain-containing protein [Blastopirellula marina]|uniref:DUF4198 domain-containing protein n=1 Tax=Blastopirellula marina TaxID=124 RepID=A0A2S8FLM5_9BACT|nr:DUF4198 domain-containing protein [Blastopirellula marina]PQO33089.1 DUF4198 domain-containing protein [Blastopirellula marina]PTL43256.1 DUF4198 domain-containing protein [Blastopirellula marina]